jgi:hypothetical protein
MVFRIVRLRRIEHAAEQAPAGSCAARVKRLHAEKPHRFARSAGSEIMKEAAL